MSMLVCHCQSKIGSVRLSCPFCKCICDVHNNKWKMDFVKIWNSIITLIHITSQIYKRRKAQRITKNPWNESHFSSSSNFSSIWPLCHRWMHFVHPHENDERRPKSFPLSTRQQFHKTTIQQDNYTTRQWQRTTASRQHYHTNNETMTMREF